MKGILLLERLGPGLRLTVALFLALALVASLAAYGSTDGSYWYWDGAAWYGPYASWNTVSNVATGALNKAGGLTTLAVLGTLGLAGTGLIIRRSRHS